ACNQSDQQKRQDTHTSPSNDAGPQTEASAVQRRKVYTGGSWLGSDSIGIVRSNLGRRQRGHLGASVNDLQIAWLIIGWLLAFWAGKDLQARFEQWRDLRRSA